MKITVLGTGTSTGVPIPGCPCEVCQSSDPKNKRLRCSVHIELQRCDVEPGENETGRGAELVGAVLIDTTPDLRQQALTYGFSKLDAVLYTHTHADHIFGIDDLRSFNFVNKKSIEVYASEENAAHLEMQFRYCFVRDPDYEGGMPPQLTMHRIKAGSPFAVCGVKILPLRVEHGSLPVMAFRIGDFAYVTDCSRISETSMEQLRGLKFLILDGLRERPHKTHFTIEQAAAVAQELQPRRTYLTHIGHELDHASANQKLKNMAAVPVELAYDGLTLTL